MKSSTASLDQGWKLELKIGNFDPEDIIIKTVNSTLEIKAERWSAGGQELVANFNHR